MTPWLGLSLALALVAGASAQTKIYLVEALATGAPDAELRAESAELQAIFNALEAQAGVGATLLFATDPDINAFATEVGDDKVVVVQVGLLDLFDADRDAVAAVLGHELAHHKADHIRAGRRKQEGTRALGAVLGVVVGAAVGNKHGELAGALGGAAVGVGAQLVALKFNRNQELEADRLSLQWMVAAGFNPDGMLRLQQQLGALEGKRKAAIFSTHPNSSKRVETARKQIAALAPAEELRTRPPTPLADAEAIAAAEAAIRTEGETRLAAALKPSTAPPSETALAPIDGIDFETFAALSNELVFADPARKREVLARHRLSEAQMNAVRDGYTLRMRQEPALAQRYPAAYHRASRGPLAAHGRDLAESFEHGRPLQLDPPYPLETAKHLLATVMARNALALEGNERAAFETEVLAPHGLTLYDFLIGHGWWSRKARIEAVGGDTRLLSDYLQAGRPPRPEPEAAGVRVGDNVRIGNNVKIGGKDAREE